MITNPALHSFTSWLSKTSPEKYDILQVFFTISAIFALLWYACMFLKSKNRYSSPLPPGPMGLPLVGNLLGLDPELHTYFPSLSQTYGPILKLQLGSKVGIVVSSPSLAREMLKDHEVTFANHEVTTAGRIVTYGGCDVLWSPYGAEWRMLRKVIVLKMLSNTTLDSLHSLRRRKVRQTVSYFYRKVGSRVNFGDQIFVTVLNVITNMIWGGTVEGEKVSLGAEFREVVLEMTQMAGKPNISDFYPALARFDLQGIAQQSERLLRRVDAIYETMIRQRRKLEELKVGEKSKDFLEFLLRLIDEQDDKTTMPLTLNHLKALFTDMVVGGSDTSSNTMEFAMAEIMNQPKVMSQIQQELDAVVGKHDIVEESHIHQLPYLEAVVKETLRLHSPVSLLISRYPSETCIVGGYTIPKGSHIFINAWALHRDPTKWENPLKFDPERFLNNNNKCDYSGSDFSYLSFGYGKRICAGIGMAERMIMYSLATLLHSFNWKVPHGETLDISEKFGIIMKKKTPLVAIPTPRLSDPALYT